MMVYKKNGSRIDCLNNILSRNNMAHTTFDFSCQFLLAVGNLNNNFDSLFLNHFSKRIF